MQQQQAPAQREFFNLHANGIGYLSRVRWVTPTGRGRKAEPFLACAISALRGAADSPDYTYFDLRVSSAEAIELIESLQKEVDERRKVLISFRIADLYAHILEDDNPMLISWIAASGIRAVSAATKIVLLAPRHSQVTWKPCC